MSSFSDLAYERFISFIDFLKSKFLFFNCFSLLVFFFFVISISLFSTLIFISIFYSPYFGFYMLLFFWLLKTEAQVINFKLLFFSNIGVLVL